MNQCQPITSRDNPLLQKLRKLVVDPVAYRKLGDVWVEGDHLCEAALTRGVNVPLAVVADTVWTGEGGSAAVNNATAHRLSALARHADKVVVVPERLWGEFSSVPSPVCVGFMLPLPTTAKPMLPGVSTLVLDRLQDAGNVGTMLRTASALGVQQVVALKGTAGLWSPKVLRAGMGAHWGLHLVEQAQQSDLSALQIPLVGTCADGQHTLPHAPLPNPCAWVMGHEGQGVDPDLLAQCDLTVRIPQPGGEESLNVGVSAAICLYESLRRSMTPL
jgi:TrmH family RNA methyltransferase